MNAVEIEQAVSELAEQPFDAAEFPYAFLMAFGNKETTIKRLRTGASNKSDIGGVLQTNNIHLATCVPGEIAATLAALRESPATSRAKAKFILACKKYNDRIAEQARKKGYAHLSKLRIPGPGLIRMGIIDSNDPSVEMVGEIVQDLFLQAFDATTDREAEKLSKTLQAARKKLQAERDMQVTLDEWSDFTGEVHPMG